MSRVVRFPSTLLLSTTLVFALLLAGCAGGKSSTEQTNSSDSGISVTMSPQKVNVAPGATQQFQASVAGTTNTAVTWSVDSVAGGNTDVGTVSNNGAYQAPMAQGNHVVKATSVADRSKFASAQISVVPGAIAISISPVSVSLSPNQQQQFTATVTGSSNTNVTWAVDGVNGGNSKTGTISTSGMYEAPTGSGQHKVSATSAADPVKVATASVTVFVQGAAAVSVLTRSYDNMRTAANLKETLLTPNNVNVNQFGKLFSFDVDGSIYTQPLIVGNVNMPGIGPENVAYVATENNSVYAFDADDRSSSPLWKKNLGTPVPCSQIVGGCSIAPNVGITATPVISIDRNAIYIEARTFENGNFVHRLHALDLSTGAEKFGGPVTITATVPGTSPKDSNNGTVTFDPKQENSRPGLLLMNGNVYLTFASINDDDPYHGWVLAYDADTLKQVAAFNTTPNGDQGGIWANNGPAADDAGNIFILTGNGTADANDFGQSFVKLSPTLNVLDYFTPGNVHDLNPTDIDVGSGGLVLVPDQPGTHPHLTVAAGKEGKIYVVDRDNMGKFNSTDKTVQEIPNAIGANDDRNFFAPAYWNAKLYFFGKEDVLKAFSFQNGLLSTSPVMKGADLNDFPGAGPTVSANADKNGIVWLTQWHVSDHTGTVRAYDANNLSRELWTSDQNATRDSLGHTTRLNIPTVANGRVYIGTTSKLVVYGLLPN